MCDVVGSATKCTQSRVLSFQEAADLSRDKSSSSLSSVFQRVSVIECMCEWHEDMSEDTTEAAVVSQNVLVEQEAPCSNIP